MFVTSVLCLCLQYFFFCRKGEGGTCCHQTYIHRHTRGCDERLPLPPNPTLLTRLPTFLLTSLPTCPPGHLPTCLFLSSTICLFIPVFLTTYISTYLPYSFVLLLTYPFNQPASLPKCPPTCMTDLILVPTYVTFLLPTSIPTYLSTTLFIAIVSYLRLSVYLLPCWCFSGKGRGGGNWEVNLIFPHPFWVVTPASLCGSLPGFVATSCVYRKVQSTVVPAVVCGCSLRRYLVCGTVAAARQFVAWNIQEVQFFISFQFINRFSDIDGASLFSLLLTFYSIKNSMEISGIYFGTS